MNGSKIYSHTVAQNHTGIQGLPPDTIEGGEIYPEDVERFGKVAKAIAIRLGV